MEKINLVTKPLTVAALLLALVSNWAYAAENIMTDPPTPICRAGDFLWEQDVDVTNLNSEGLPIVDVRLVRINSESFTIPGPYPAELGAAVTLSVDDVVAWDGYVGRMNTPHQPNERYRIVFLKNGILVGGTGFTGDETDDGINTGWESDDWRGPLDQGIFLPNGTDEIRIVHWSDGEFGMDDTSSPNSVVPVSICISSQPPARLRLGDRVWEDENVNGVQDCTDGGANDPNFPADGIIGNAGDAGPECGAGIPDVPVNLLVGDCQTSLGQTVMTDLNGFYLFPDLDPGNYCVEFGKPPADFCDTNGFDLGEPQFTAQNAGNDDAVDSDAGTGTGVSDPVSLAAGETNLTVDAGIFCPAKIGDRVWSDNNQDGLQEPGEAGVPGVIVNLFECTGGQAIVDNNKLVRTTTTDDAVNDMNYMFGAEPGFDLVPGEYFVQFMKPDGTQFTTPNVNGDNINSDCLPPDGISACTTLGSRGINLNRDCGLIPPPPPECDLDLDKQCRVETPPVSGNLECEAKIAASVLEYTGPGTPSVITVTGTDKKSQVVSSFDAATGILTVDARPGDLGAKMTITTDGVEEVIHTSCSAPYVAGQPAPLDSPKGAPSDNWLVLSFVDKNGGSASLPGDGNGDGMFTDNCTVTQPPQPSCDTVGKPNTLTFKYTGGACSGDNNQGSKADCLGSVDGVAMVTISVNTADNYTVSPAVVAPGGMFTVTRNSQDFKSNTDIDLSNSGGIQQNDVHTSCSAPLAVGDEFGAITLVGMNGQTGGVDVTYRYVVTNNGDPLSGVLVTDDPLGAVGGPIDMIKDQTETFFKSARITGTTINTGMAVGLLSDGSECPAADSTTVTVVEPPVVGGECDGKVTDLVLKNLGADAQVRVDQKKDGTVFDDFVPTGGEFSFSGTDKKDTLGTEISIFVNGSLNTKIHTSCSQPIGPGLVSGNFEVISGSSRNGGPLPPL